MAQVLQHVEEFLPTELTLVATAAQGAIVTSSPVEVG